MNMIDDMNSLILLSFLIFLLTILLMIVRLINRYKDEPPEQMQIPTKPKQTNKDINLLDSLEFMRDHNIISSQEFNQLFVKVLPYVEGKKGK